MSRERRLALALRAVLDSLRGIELSATEGYTLDDVNNAEQSAIIILNDLGYSTLIGIPRRLKELNEQLTAAVAAGDGKCIAELGLELERAKAGKLLKSAAPSAVKKSFRKSGTTATTVSTEVDLESATAATAGGE